MKAVKEKKVKDIMKPVAEYTRVRADSTVKEAVLTLKKSLDPDGTNRQEGHRTILVTDESGSAVGLLTLNALMRSVEPQFVKADQWALPIFWDGLFTERCREEAGKKIREVMIPVEDITMDVEDTIIKAVHILLKHDLGSLPVTKNGDLVGMVRIIEIFNEIGGMVAGQPGPAQPLPDLKKAMSY